MGSYVSGLLFNSIVGANFGSLAEWRPLWYLTGSLTAAATVVFVLAFRLNRGVRTERIGSPVIGVSGVVDQ